MEYRTSSTMYKKLSNGHSFNDKSAYDGVFAAPTKKVGAPNFPARVEDFSEIFSVSRGSSIPILDIPALNERKLSVDVRSSNFEYSKVFGGFEELDFAVPYDDEHLLVEPKKMKATSVDPKSRTVSRKSSSLTKEDPFEYPEGKGVSSHEASPFQSFDSGKKFSVSYQKTNPGSKKGTNGATHIAQLHAVPGYTRLIDEATPFSGGDKPKSGVSKDAEVKSTFSKVAVEEGKLSGAVNDACLKNNSIKVEMEEKVFKEDLSTVGPTRQTSKSTEYHNATDWFKLRSRSNSVDFLFDEYKIDKTAKSPKVPENSRKPPKFGRSHGYSHRSMEFKSRVCDAGNVDSPPYFEEEFDENSVNAVSVAALRKAIEDAQARIKFVKDSLERRKDSQNQWKPGFRNGVNTRRGEKKISGNASKPKGKKVEETCRNTNILLQTTSGSAKQNSTQANTQAAAVETYTKVFESNQVNCTQGEAEHSDGEECWYDLDNAFEDEARRPGLENAVHTNKDLQFVNDYEQRESQEANLTFENLENSDERLARFDKAREQEKIEKRNGEGDFGEYVCVSKSQQEIHNQEDKQKRIEVSQQMEEMRIQVATHEEETCQKMLEESQGPTEDSKVETKESDENKIAKIQIQDPEWVDKEEMKRGLKQKENEIDQKNVNIHMGEETEKEQDKVDEQEIETNWNNDFCNGEETEELENNDVTEGGENEKMFGGFSEHMEENEKRYEPIDEVKGIQTQIDKSAEVEDLAEESQEDLKYCENKLEKATDFCVHSESEILVEEEGASRPVETDLTMEVTDEVKEVVDQDVEVILEVPKYEETGNVIEVTEAAENIENDSEGELGEADRVEKTLLRTASLDGGVLREETNKMEDIIDTLVSDPYPCGMNFGEFNTECGNMQDDKHEKDTSNASILENHAEELAPDLDEMIMNVEEAEVAIEETDETNSRSEENISQSSHGEGLLDDLENDETGLPFRTSEKYEDSTEIVEESITSQGTTENEENHSENLTMEGKESNYGSNIEESLQSGTFEGYRTMELAREINRSQSATETEEDREETETVEDMDATDALEKEAELKFHVEPIEVVEQHSLPERREETTVETAQEIITSPSIRQHGENHQTTVTFEEIETDDKLQEEGGMESEVNNQRAEQAPGMPQGKGTDREISEEIKTRQSALENEENHQSTITIEVKETNEKSEKEMELEKKQRKIIEASEREREREREKIAVERAIREARERAFAEARERAAAERASAENHRRQVAEGRERTTKTPMGNNDNNGAEKASVEAKLKAERAAVERATAEARERALEKAISEKAFLEARNLAEKMVSDQLSTATGDRWGYSSKGSQQKASSSSCSSRYESASNNGAAESSERFTGSAGESAQRSKARLERHQPTVERVAKALSEKNIGDLLAQKEQAERNRLAKALDADVKRWSSGKEGNLRALLSTLQFVLGHDSGWQAIPLSDIVTAAAVKKAYRKATLFVHPDKLQQRGATIQQKYICEKVFDLLKAAWNRFNREER